MVSEVSPTSDPGFDPVLSPGSGAGPVISTISSTILAVMSGCRDRHARFLQVFCRDLGGAGPFTCLLTPSEQGVRDLDVGCLRDVGSGV